jgi:RNA polymerase sigma-70 factor (ECF subfamily)
MASNSLLRTDKEFASVYDRNIGRVYQICCLYLKNRHDAEDASQRIFEKYLCSDKTFADEQHEKAWFITVSKNHCRDELRRFWKRKRVDLENAEDDSARTSPNDDGGLAEALLNLPAKYKEVLYLYYIEGYSVKEMSGLLRRNESTLRNHLSAGRKLLRIDLGGYYER